MWEGLCIPSCLSTAKSRGGWSTGMKVDAFVTLVLKSELLGSAAMLCIVESWVDLGQTI
jgi:hypothetical protein